MWVTAEYEPVAVFGLRPSNTTSSGGKSLLIPTPYAIKMALLDRAICTGGLDYGRGCFLTLRDLHIYAHVPALAVVTRSFQKVLRPGDKERVWTSTIAQREYVVHAGPLVLAFGHDNDAFMQQDLMALLTAVNYFGRRGSFFQVTQIAESEPDAGFIDLCAPSMQLSLGFLQRMDDMRHDATFTEVSTYHKKGQRDDGGRVSYNIILPYQLAYHGFNHTVYRREESVS